MSSSPGDRGSGVLRLAFDARELDALVPPLKRRIAGDERPRVLLAGGAAGDRYFTAQRLANELGSPLLELSVPRCLRSVPKRLHAAVAKARRTGSVLLFDEADALFSKRGELRRTATRAGRNATYLLRTLGRHGWPILLSTEASDAVLKRLEALCKVVVSFDRTEAEPTRPHAARHFRVVIAKRELDFCTVGPLTTETEPSVTEPGPPAVHLVPRVVMRRAIDSSRYLFAWRQAILDGKRDRRDVLVEVLDRPGGDAVSSWRLCGAWPARWSGPTLDALAESIAMEEVELLYERLAWL